MLKFLTHVELSRSIVAMLEMPQYVAYPSRSIVAMLEMPQYVAYPKNVAYALFTLSTKSHTFNKYCTIMPLLDALLNKKKKESFQES